MIPGVSFEEISKAIEDSYTYNELTRVIRTGMNTRLDLVTAPGALQDVVFELLSWAERNGRESELVRVVSRARSDHLDMQRIYRLYGMAIPLAARQTGIPIPHSPKYVSEAGLESVIRPYTGFTKLSKWRDRLTEVEAQVCRITIDGNPAGTGFLVGPDAVLTNFHVVRTIEGLEGHTSPSEVKCEFDYKVLKTGARTLTPVSLKQPGWLIDSSPPTPQEDLGDAETQPGEDQLDYALLRLDRRFGEEPALEHPGEKAPARGWISVPLAAPNYQSPMAVLIPQHPDGQPLKLAADTEAINQVKGFWLNGNQTRIRYAANTEPGASGSPCFDFDWNLIALHHYGDGGYGVGHGFNQGVPIAAIRHRLERPESGGAAGALG
jgi:hypothetical protein